MVTLLSKVKYILQLGQAIGVVDKKFGKGKKNINEYIILAQDTLKSLAGIEKEINGYINEIEKIEDYGDKKLIFAIEQERKPAGFMNSVLGSIRGDIPEEHNMRSFQSDLLTIDFDKVQAIGDIMLINPRDIKKVNTEPQIPEGVTPNHETQPQTETQTQFNQERL